MWKDLPKNEYVAYFEKTMNEGQSYLVDRIANVIGKDNIGSRPAPFRVGTVPVHHPIVRDINDHTFYYDVAVGKTGRIRGAHPTRCYALRYNTLKNMIIPNMENNCYYKFRGFSTYNNSNLYPDLNGKDLVYVFENLNTGEFVNLSCFMAYNSEFPTLVEFFGSNVIQYMLDLYGHGRELGSETHLFTFEQIA